jgi:hypothetical protein
VLQRAGSALYRERGEMLLQCNSKVVLSESRYSKGLLYTGAVMVLLDNSDPKKNRSSKVAREL